MSYKEFHEQNRLSWNAATHQHHTHRPDLIAKFQSGYNHLHTDEMHLLREAAGKSLVHLQCNDGQDSLSIAKHIGATVTGVDISETAIAAATRIAEEAQIPATFVRADIFDWFEGTDQQFDYVYTGYGALCWIASLIPWAAGVAKVLKPGGQLVVMEFHPLGGIFEIDWSLTYDYMGGKPIVSEGVGDYVGDDYEGHFKNPHPAYEFAWGIGNILSAVLDSGLLVKRFHEYPYINGWKRFPDMRSEPATRRHYLPADKPLLPLMFSLVAQKPES